MVAIDFECNVIVGKCYCFYEFFNTLQGTSIDWKAIPVGNKKEFVVNLAEKNYIEFIWGINWFCLLENAKRARYSACRRYPFWFLKLGKNIVLLNIKNPWPFSDMQGNLNWNSLSLKINVIFFLCDSFDEFNFSFPSSTDITKKIWTTEISCV